MTAEPSNPDTLAMEQVLAADMAQYRKEVQRAHEARKCVACNESIDGRIYSPAGRAKYQISGMCEVCFDDMFQWF